MKVEKIEKIKFTFANESTNEYKTIEDAKERLVNDISYERNMIMDEERDILRLQSSIKIRKSRIEERQEGLNQLENL